MPRGGLLSGMLGGATEGGMKAIDTITKQSLEDRAQARKDAAALALEKARGDNDMKLEKLRGRGKGGSGSEEKGFTIKTEKYDNDGIEAERLVKVYDTGVKEELYDMRDYKKYQKGVLDAYKTKKMSGLEIDQSWGEKYGLPSGLADFIINNPDIR